MERGWNGPILAVVIAVVGWEASSMATGSPYLPPLGDVIDAWQGLWSRGELGPNVLRSLSGVSQGLLLSLVGGVSIGLAMARVRWLGVALRPYVDLMIAMPLAVMIPVFAVVFSRAESVVIATVVVYCTFDILENTRMGVLGTRPELLDMSRAFGVSRIRCLLGVVIPSAMHMMLTGIGVAVSKAFKAAILGEMLITVVGLGGRIRYYGDGFRVPELYALTGTTVVLAVVASFVTEHLSSRLRARYPLGRTA